MRQLNAAFHEHGAAAHKNQGFPMIPFDDINL
jgi:hypothetical protein